MAIAAVQKIAKGVPTAVTATVGSGDGWLTPGVGNLLVVTGNSDATVTMTTAGFTAGPSVVDGNGAYSWWKFADGTETAITITPGVTANTVITCAEYSGVAALDASNSTTIGGTQGNTTNAATVTTTATGDLIVGAALLHGYSTGVPTGAAWTNSFVNQLTADTGANTTNHCTTFYADLIGAGAAGSYSTVATWTNNAGDRQHLILAFTASAGGGAPADPMVWHNHTLTPPGLQGPAGRWPAITGDLVLPVVSSVSSITVGLDPIWSSNTGTNTITSAAFSPAAASLIVVDAIADSGATGITAGITDSVGLTWTPVGTVQDGGSGGAAMAWWAYTASAQTSMTVTTTWTGSGTTNTKAVKVSTYTGTATTSVVSSKAQATSAVNNLTVNVNTTADGCRIAGVAIDWNALGAPTSTDTITAFHTALAISGASVRKTANSSGVGTSVSLNFDAFSTGTPDWGYKVYEIAPGAGGGGGSASPAAVDAAGSGTADNPTPAVTVIAVDGAATGTAVDAVAGVAGNAVDAAAAGAAAAPSTAVTVNAVDGAAAGAAFDATVSTAAAVNAPAVDAAAAGTAVDAVAAAAVTAVDAAATGAAFDATVSTASSVSAPAVDAAATGAAFDAAVAVAAAAVDAAATGAGQPAGPAVAVAAVDAAATGDAFFDVGSNVSLDLTADNPIDAVGDAFDATISTASGLSANAAQAAATGDAYTPATAVVITAATASGTGAAFDTAPSAGVAAGQGAATGAAADASTVTTVIPAEAAAVGAAFDATVSTASQTSANAVDGAAAGAAYDTLTAVTVTPPEAAAAATAFDATVSTAAQTSANAVDAASTGQAFDAAVAVAAPAGQAAATGDAVNPVGQVGDEGPAGTGTATGAAFDAQIVVTVNAATADSVGDTASTAAAGIPAGTGAAAGAALPVLAGLGGAALDAAAAGQAFNALIFGLSNIVTPGGAKVGVTGDTPPGSVTGDTVLTTITGPD